MEAFLLHQLKELKADQLVAGALHHIYQSKGNIRITKLAELLDTSDTDRILCIYEDNDGREMVSEPIPDAGY